MNLTNGMCINECENYPNCIPCGIWKNRYKVYKKGLGLTNKDIAESLGLSLNSVEVMVNKKDGSFPKWAKLAIITYETMLANGRITYDKPEAYKVETAKK